MRDRLDGIKTKDGRVVYDRRKHPFNEKDLLRILKKVNSLQGSPVLRGDCIFQAEYARAALWLVWTVADAARDSGCYDVQLGLQRGLRDILTALSTIRNFGGGDFGGAGASR